MELLVQQALYDVFLYTRPGWYALYDGNVSSLPSKAGSPFFLRHGDTYKVYTLSLSLSYPSSSQYYHFYLISPTLSLPHIHLTPSTPVRKESPYMQYKIFLVTFLSSVVLATPIAETSNLERRKKNLFFVFPSFILCNLQIMHHIRSTKDILI